MKPIFMNSWLVSKTWTRQHKLDILYKGEIPALGNSNLLIPNNDKVTWPLYKEVF